MVNSKSRELACPKPLLETAQLFRNIAVIVLALLLCVPCLSGQQLKTPLTLAEALAYALQHSPRLSAMRQGVTTQQNAIAAARAKRLPHLDLGAAMRGSSQSVETAMGVPLTALADIPQGQPFSKGHLNADISATIPVYTGGRISSAVSLAKAQRRLVQISVSDVERGLVFDVTSTYASLSQLDRDIEAVRESVDALSESRRVVAQMFDEGKVARVDLLKVDTRLADVQDAAIEFRSAREIQAGQLNALLGRAVDTSIIVETLLSQESPQLSLDQTSQLPPTGNTKYQIAQAQVSVAERSVAVAKSELRPALSLTADLREMSTDPFSVYKSGVVAAAVFKFPLFDRSLTQQVEEAKSRELERRDQLKQEELDSAQRTRTAYLQRRNAEERIRATKTAIGYAREALRIEQEKQRYGRSIIENLLDAQAALLTSEARYYRALADLATAAAALTRETGN